MPVYRHGNRFSDTPFGPDGKQLTTAIRALTVGNRRRKPGHPLAPAGDPPAIEAERVSVLRNLGGNLGGGTGLADPIVVQPYTGTTYFHEVSADGNFVMEFGHETTTIDDGGEGSTLHWQQVDPSA